MIQTSIAPDSFAGVEPVLCEALLLSLPPPQAATIRPATHSAASNHFDVFTIPPRSSPGRAGTRTAAAPDMATLSPLNAAGAALRGGGMGSPQGALSAGRSSVTSRYRSPR